VVLVNQHAMIGFRRCLFGDVLGCLIELMAFRFRKQTNQLLQFFKRIQGSELSFRMRLPDSFLVEAMYTELLDAVAQSIPAAGCRLEAALFASA
jgi:hypothetical protein